MTTFTYIWLYKNVPDFFGKGSKNPLHFSKMLREELEAMLKTGIRAGNLREKESAKEALNILINVLVS